MYNAGSAMAMATTARTVHKRQARVPGKVAVRRWCVGLVEEVINKKIAPSSKTQRARAKPKASLPKVKAVGTKAKAKLLVAAKEKEETAKVKTEEKEKARKVRKG